LVRTGDVLKTLVADIQDKKALSAPCQRQVWQTDFVSMLFASPPHIFDTDLCAEFLGETRSFGGAKRACPARFVSDTVGA
jgi:hypothetical protein